MYIVYACRADGQASLAKVVPATPLSNHRSQSCRLDPAKKNRMSFYGELSLQQKRLAPNKITSI